MNDRSKTYMNPYLAGVLLGIVLLMTYYVTGRGPGASGGIKSVVVAISNFISHSATVNNKYFGGILANESSPLKAWLFIELFGVLIGAIISGSIMGRMKLKVEHSPKITARRRLVFATLGGILFGIGSQFGRGCTSGAALSGLALLSTSGFVAMMTIFGGGYLFAYFFRKNWI